MRVQDEGYAVLPIENEGRSMLQLIQHHGEGELMSQWVACWDVDAWSYEVLVALETGQPSNAMNPLSKDRKKSNARGVRRIRFPHGSVWS